MDIQKWQGILESHHTLLNKHLETISRVQQNLQNGSDAAQFMQSCINQTETALQTFKVAAYRFMAELHSQALPQPTTIHPSTISTSVLGGVTGPTPAEQVQQSHSVRKPIVGKKRKAPTEESSPAQPSISCTSSPLKRARARPTRQVPPTPHRPTPAIQEGSERGEHDGEGGGSDDDPDRSYLEAVEAKLKEKEEKMWKGMVKKRKRSLSDVDGISEDRSNLTKTPLLPKIRKKNVPAVPTADDNKTGELRNRSSDLSSRTAGHLEQGLPRARAKQRRATGSKEMVGR
ncbi:hypothetical protein DV738_g5525, partial [Chaetothyriales sp. CBS 135597]